MELFIVFLSYPFDIIRAYLCPLILLVTLEVCQFHVLKKKKKSALHFTDLVYRSSFSISLLSALFISLLPRWGLFCSSFSGPLQWALSLSRLDFPLMCPLSYSCFLLYLSCHFSHCFQDFSFIFSFQKFDISVDFFGFLFFVFCSVY